MMLVRARMPGIRIDIGTIRQLRLGTLAAGGVFSGLRRCSGTYWDLWETLEGNVGMRIMLMLPLR